MPRLAVCCALLVTLLAPALGCAATVTVPGDYPTIQEAVDQAADGTVIQIAAGIYNGRVNIVNSARALVLRGDLADPAAVILNGAGARDSVVFVANYTGSLVIEGLTITGGHADPSYGGGLSILSSANVVVRDCVVSGNTAAQSGGGVMLVSAGGLFQRCVITGNSANYWGGGVLMDVGSTTTFDRCQIVNNQSNLTAPAGGGGGGIYVSNSSPTFVGCLIQGNHAKFAGGGMWVQSAYASTPYVVTLLETTVADNEAVRADSSLPGSEGGGIHIEDNTRVVLERCQVRGNRSNRGGGLNSFRGRYELTDTVVEDNVVTRDGTQEGNGGGIFATSYNPAEPARAPAAIVLRRSVVRGNTADTGGGIFIGGDFGITTQRGVLDMADSIVADNTSVGSGGGIYANRVVMTVTNSLVTGNDSDAYGGGVLSDGSSLITLDGTTLADNEATEQGGAIEINQGGSLQVAQSRLVSNRSYPAFGGGALYIGPSDGPILAAPITGSVTGSVIADNGPNVQLVEDCAGDLSKVSALAYTGNTIHGSGVGLRWEPCTGLISTVDAFNALSKASGNVDVPPTFAHFVAAPRLIVPGTSSALGWAVAPAGSHTVDGGIGALPGAIGNLDASPASTTTYTLSALSGASLGTATVEVTCADLGMPIPLAPGNAASGQGPGSVQLAWTDTEGAASYDVYLDTNDPPSTLVAEDVEGTSTTVDGLAIGMTYHWRVVAKSPACALPAAGPVFSFLTCATSACHFSDGFDDGDASDWTKIGKGKARVVDGRLILTGRRKLTMLAPIPSMGDGTMSLSLLLPTRRARASVLFAYQGKRKYRELYVKGSGRLQLRERARRARRTVRRARLALPVGTPFTIGLDVTGGDVWVLLNGSPSFSGSFGESSEGQCGVLAEKSTSSIDDVEISAR